MRRLLSLPATLRRTEDDASGIIDERELLLPRVRHLPAFLSRISMTEIRYGVRHLLSSPHVYDLFQSLVGAYAWRKNAIARHVIGSIRDKGLVIDIGSGTSEILNYLPADVEYVGFDRNLEYIKQARLRFAHRNARFVCEEFLPDSNLTGRAADVVLAFGLIHHLDDEHQLSPLQKCEERTHGKRILLDA
jgi:SAM-dependent methyltransferase